MFHGTWDITNSCFEKGITRKNEQDLAAIHENFQEIGSTKNNFIKHCDRASSNSNNKCMKLSINCTKFKSKYTDVIALLLPNLITIQR